jgi:hypothetical protein
MGRNPSNSRFYYLAGTALHCLISMLNTIFTRLSIDGMLIVCNTVVFSDCYDDFGTFSQSPCRLHFTFGQGQAVVLPFCMLFSCSLLFFVMVF